MKCPPDANNEREHARDCVAFVVTSDGKEYFCCRIFRHEGKHHSHSGKNHCQKTWSNNE